MDRDSNLVLEELEWQWDLSQEAAESALDDWYQDEDEDGDEDEPDPELIDAVLETQKEQRDRYKAVRDHKRIHSL
jgi:hypothetical protein